MITTAIHPRPRGFIKWRPQAKTRALLEKVNWDYTADQTMAENPDSNGANPDIFKRTGMDGARMNILDWRQNGFESRLKMIEDFLEIQDSAECNNCLSNRIIEAMNATTEALNGNIDLACKELERRLIYRIKCLEERLEAIESGYRHDSGFLALLDESVDERFMELRDGIKRLEIEKENRA